MESRSHLLPILSVWLAVQLSIGCLAQVQPINLPAPEFITDRQGLPQAFVPAIVQDRQGFIWMATRDGLARYDGSRFKVFQPDPDGRPSLSSTDVAQLQLDHHGKLWMTNERGDLDVFDPRTEQFINLSQQPIFKRLKLNPGQFNRFCVDQHDRLWITADTAGLVCLNLSSNRIKQYRHQPNQPYSISHNSIFGILEAPNGAIWILTKAGLDCLDERSRTIRHYLKELDTATDYKGLWVRPSGDVLVMTSQWLYVVHPASGQVRQYALPVPSPVQSADFAHFAEARAGTLYIAWSTYIYAFNDKQGIRLLDSSPRQTRNTYQSTFIDQSEVLWLGTAGAGVRKYNLRTLPFQTARYQTEFLPDLFSQGWLNLPAQRLPAPLAGLTSYNFRYAFDGQGRLWYNAGSSDCYRVDFQTGQTEPVPFPIRFRSAFVGKSPCPMATDPDGRVWAVYESAAFYYDSERTRWIQFPFPIPCPTGCLQQMLVVDEQALWIATSIGGLFRINRTNGQVQVFSNVRNNPATLSSNALLCLAEDPDSTHLLWIGTFGSGLCRFDKRSGTSKRFSIADGLPNNVIYSAIPDHRGDLWMGTNKGIARFNRRTFTIQTYTLEDGILANEFNRFHFLHFHGRGRAADRILMGGLEGITAFYPHQIKRDSFQPRVEITSLYVNNKPVVPEPDSPLGNLPIQAVEALTLPYDQNFLTIDFAAMQFNKPAKNKYRYQLVGLAPAWVESRRAEVVFTGLQPGTYTLRLNASNVSGQWSPHIRTLTIRIQPPWWATWWAYAIYALLITGLAYGLFRNYINRLNLRQSMQLKEHETEQLRDLNAMKTRFFANITHEFRTPLTLILGPTEQLMDEALEPRIRRRLRTIEQNAHQLLRLINQLLDLSRLEASVMPVQPSRGNLADCITHWLAPLSEQATAQGITLSFRAEVSGSYWFDVEKFERIVYNLTANALKFTPVGTVTVSVVPLPEGIQLTVADTGIGIAAQHLPHIFDRFYQVASEPAGSAAISRSKQAQAPQPLGAGIGLALVNELVQLQQGTITVDSVPGQGTTFVVTLPYAKADGAENPAVIQPIEADSQPTGSDATPEARILLVEDNDELAQFITQNLPDFYRIDRAINGLDGLRLALKHVPDLIISDIMMPGMDGLTLCGQLKIDLRTSHIPVMLLTAKVTREDRLEGLTQGADEYLTKPFQVAELRLRVRNLLEQSRRQRDWVRQQLIGAEPVREHPPVADPFLTRLYALLEANLSNPRLSVDQLTDELAMSRTNLHRKVKALTGFSANEVVRHYRLKAATTLLRQGLNSAQTADRVGFESPSYFAKCFREVYGVTPAEFVRKQGIN
ncbi:response regulator [Fibrisoma montanum]|uniref:histidine kinase n=1 Tax=Fibrisoma montanum TaxID=2305895 RepID=A0A418MBX1_9BACT|nr:response regulator [Fibrisoma montanum]